MGKRSLRFGPDFADRPEEPAVPPPVFVEKRQKANHIGAPAVFALELACRQINEAFGGHGCYIVGSALDRPDWRDVDVRFILEDDEFQKLFPDALDQGRHEHDARWLILTTSISAWLSKVSGLPIDFQFQQQTHANKWHDGPRHAVGLRFAK